MPTTMQRARAKLNANRKSTSSVMKRAKGMQGGLRAHPALFPDPSPSISAVEDQIVLLDDAEVLAATRARGSASARNVERNRLMGMLETQMTYVQNIADESSTWDQAVATIEAAGLEVSLVATHDKQILTVKQGPEPGSVLLSAYAAALAGPSWKKRFFNWEYTGDGGATFIRVRSTPKSKTSIANLTPLHTYGFRVSVTDANAVDGPWSQIVTFLVH